MFNSITPWGWVAIAYGQLVLAYAGYVLYLRWRERRVTRREDD